MGPEDAALVFTGEMYAVQLDQLADVLGATQRRVSGLAARWRASGTAETAVLSPGARWVWLTRTGLAACGLPYRAGPPGLSRVAHLRAVTAVRLALAATPQFGSAGAFWRSERRIRARIGGRIGLREHVPDAEVHWPDGDADSWAADSWAAVPWAGECWAIEAELTAKTVARTVTIMRELLARTGDYGCPAADAAVPGRTPRHARVVYVCTRAALPVVTRAREELGHLGARVEIRLLPPGAELGPLPRQARRPAVVPPARTP